MAQRQPAIVLDEDVRPRLAELLRDRGFDAVAVSEVHRTGLADEDQLAWAAAQERILVSHNIADFARLARSWGAAGWSHAGVMLVQQGSLGSVLQAVLRALADLPTAEDWKDRVVWAQPPPPRSA